MTALDVAGHRLAKFAPAAGPAEFVLEDDKGRALNIAGTDYTFNPATCRGNREQMKRMLETVPEGLRRRLRPRQVSFPSPHKMGHRKLLFVLYFICRPNVDNPSTRSGAGASRTLSGKQGLVAKKTIESTPLQALPYPALPAR